MSRRSVTVINYTAPEMNHLAAELAQSGRLASYVRPYANQGRVWERWLEAFPGFGSFYRTSFGRRTLPPGFSPGQVRETAIFSDITLATLRRIQGGKNWRFSDDLHWKIQREVAAEGARYGAAAETVVASYVVAQPAFERAEGRRILNYPIAHHRYIQRFVADEAQREPGFASTLPNWRTVPSWVEPQLDAECELADYILIGSSFARQSFQAEGLPPDKLIVIPYGADLSRFSPHASALKEDDAAAPSGRFRVLFVGQIGQRKGISYLLRGYRAFQGPGTYLTLVGEYSGDPEALAPYRNLFHHISHVPQGVLADLYRQADVFVFPTLIEGLGLVVLEAMASGLTVITTPNGPGDLVRDGIDGFLVAPRDAAAITEKLEFLRSNPERRAQMGRNARQRALSFTWEEYRRKTSIFLLDEGHGTHKEATIKVMKEPSVFGASSEVS